MSADLPLVSVVVPVLDEERDIAACLQAVLAQDHPRDRLEVIVVDGGSRDATAEVAEKVLATGDVAWRILVNNVGTTPSNLNAGLAAARGTVICRVDARSHVPPRYVRLCAEILQQRPEVMVTGGAQIALAVDGTARSLGIARALNNRFTMGGSRYRSAAGSGPADTVYLGAFRVDDLRRAGGWDERLATNQDFELNRRLGREGVIWVDDRLRVGYVPRGSLTELWRQYRRFGRWKVRYWRLTGDRPLARQRFLLAAPPVLVAATVPLLARAGRGVATGASLAMVGVAAVIEDRGASGPQAGPWARAIGVAAMVVVAGGWWTGVLSEALRPSRSAAPSALPPDRPLA